MIIWLIFWRRDSDGGYSSWTEAGKHKIGNSVKSVDYYNLKNSFHGRCFDKCYYSSAKIRKIQENSFDVNFYLTYVYYICYMFLSSVLKQLYVALVCLIKVYSINSQDFRILSRYRTCDYILCYIPELKKIMPKKNQIFFYPRLQ